MTANHTSQSAARRYIEIKRYERNRRRESVAMLGFGLIAVAALVVGVWVAM